MSDKFCQKCGIANPVWFTPNEVWNRATGGDQCKGDPGGVLCPICLIDQAESAGITPTAWLLLPEDDLIPRSEAEAMVKAEREAAATLRARVEELEGALRQIEACARNNYGRQTEKLADIAPLARTALKGTDHG